MTSMASGRDLIGVLYPGCDTPVTMKSLMKFFWQTAGATLADMALIRRNATERQKP